MFQIKVVEKIKTHIICSVAFFSENRAVYVTTSKNLAEPETRQTTIWRRVACWISKATRAQARANARARTHEHTRKHARTYKYARHCFSTATVVFWLTCLNITLYVHSSLVLLCKVATCFGCTVQTSDYQI